MFTIECLLGKGQTEEGIIKINIMEILKNTKSGNLVIQVIFARIQKSGGRM